MALIEFEDRAVTDSCKWKVETGCLEFSDGHIVELTVTQETIFECLLDHPRFSIPHTKLEEACGISNQTLRAHIGDMRIKLGPRAIRTSYGRGYALMPQFIR